MRVGIGVILSVLSSSVLAAVIPNYDSHGILLVRRAVNPENRFILWKRAGEEQAGPGPSSSGSGASTEASTSNGQSNLDYSSDNRGSNKLKQFLEFLKGLYRSLKISWNTQRQKYIRRRDKKSVQIAVKKVAEITKGNGKGDVTSAIEKLLDSALESSRMAFELFKNKAKSPLFSVSISKGKTQKTVNNEMVRIQGLAKKEVKTNLDFLTITIASITKLPLSVKTGLDGISNSISDMFWNLKALYDKEYKNLISIMGDANNKGHIQATEGYLSEMTKYRGVFNADLVHIEDLIENGKVTLQKRPHRNLQP
ncbi:hypothetical protein BASA83_012060 [Batrachochytrium salamandrivorans]|nr:hypothetical protein BASA83_012060 [Batrachochytrium salamandrivorans]